MENTINTKNVAFVAYKDGTFLVPEQDDKDNRIMPAYLFRAIKNYIRTMDKEQTAAMALGWLIEGTEVPKLIADQVKLIGEEKSN